MRKVSSSSELRRGVARYIWIVSLLHGDPVEKLANEVTGASLNLDLVDRAAM